MIRPPHVAGFLARAAGVLADRVPGLESRLQERDERSWIEHRKSVGLLARVAQHVDRTRQGQLLATREMADRLQQSEDVAEVHGAE